MELSTTNLDWHGDEVSEALNRQIRKALTEIGLAAEGYAKLLCPVDTGNLRNSITFQVDDEESSVYIGTNVNYAPYIELGTGEANYPGGTQKTSWVYMSPDGKFHRAYPQKARPYLRPAVADHLDDYRNIIEAELRR